jgi:hypothetical protein
VFDNGCNQLHADRVEQHDQLFNFRGGIQLDWDLAICEHYVSSRTEQRHGSHITHGNQCRIHGQDGGDLVAAVSDRWWFIDC